jgi:DNA-binding response OmpR family regulator
MSGLNILLVEDSEVVAKRLMNSLRELPFVLQVKQVKCKEAFERAIEFRPDAIIMDCHPPDGFNGSYLIRVLKEINAVLIVLSNETDAIYKNYAFKEGADFYFDKTNDYKKMEIALSEISIKSKSQTELL